MNTSRCRKHLEQTQKDLRPLLLTRIIYIYIYICITKKETILQSNMFLEYKDISNHAVAKVFCEHLTREFPDMLKHVFWSNMDPRRPPWFRSKCSYVKVCPEATLIREEGGFKHTPHMDQLHVQIRRLPNMSDEEYGEFRSKCDAIYKRVVDKPVDKPVDATKKDTKEVEKKDLFRGPRFELRSSNDRNHPGVQMSLEEMLGVLDSQNSTVTDVHGNTHTIIMNRICGYCNAGYGKNKSFPESGKRCTGCLKKKAVYYCDKHCQQKDWKRHKTHCPRLDKKKKLKFLFDLPVVTTAVPTLKFGPAITEQQKREWKDVQEEFDQQTSKMGSKEKALQHLMAKYLSE